MQRYLIPALALSFAGGSAAAQEDNAGFIPIADCIVSNAPAVERAVSDLSDAAQFLASGVCAVAIADRVAAERKAQYDTYRAKQQELCKAGETDEEALAVDYMCDGDLLQFGFVELVSSSTPVTKPPADALALASKTLLELRIARLDSAAEGKQ